MKRYQDIADPALAKALAHPLRTRILATLEDRIASPSEIAAELDAPLGVVSYHVRRLHALRFLKLVKRVPRRGALEHYYTTVAGPRITNAAWDSTPTIVKQAMVGAALAEIGEIVTSAAAAGGFEPGDAHLSRSPLRLDPQGWSEVAGELDALNDRLQKIEAESRKRLDRADQLAQQQATVVLMLFSSAQPNPDGGAPAKDAKRRAASGASRRRSKSSGS